MSNEKSNIIGTDSSIGPSDVLLGRGNHLQNSGNEKFRNLVRTRATAYWLCKDNVTKGKIARQIVDSVASEQGRFLRRVKISSKGNTTGATGPSLGDNGVCVPIEGWEVADMDTVLVKVKQTFRDFAASNKKREVVSSLKKPPHPASVGSRNLQQVSILERLQNCRNLNSSPFIQIPDTMRKNSSPLTPADDAQEILFQNICASQLDHLVHNAQQQMRHNDNQDQQLMSLFEHQRTILMSQLQQSSITSEKKPYVTQVLLQHQQPQDPGIPFPLTQPTPIPLHHEPIRNINIDDQFPSTVPTQHQHQSYQDQFMRGQIHQRHPPYFINQNLQQVSSNRDGGVLYQPQLILDNSIGQQNQRLSSMNFNEMSNIHNFSLQPMPPHTQHGQQSLAAEPNSFMEHFGGSTFHNRFSITNATNLSSNTSLNDVLAFAGQLLLPVESIPYTPPPFPQQATTTEHLNNRPALQICYEVEDDGGKGDKKPPAH